MAAVRDRDDQTYVSRCRACDQWVRVLEWTLVVHPDGEILCVGSNVELTSLRPTLFPYLTPEEPIVDQVTGELTFCVSSLADLCPFIILATTPIRIADEILPPCGWEDGHRHQWNWPHHNPAPCVATYRWPCEGCGDLRLGLRTFTGERHYAIGYCAQCQGAR